MNEEEAEDLGKSTVFPGQSGAFCSFFNQTSFRFDNARECGTCHFRAEN